MLNYAENDAVISDCGMYRYLLRRIWNHDLPRVLIIMLNPSTADAQLDDATIRSCVRLCSLQSYGGFEVVNLFAFRATDPRQLKTAQDAVGPKNDLIIEAAIGRCDQIICAWGAWGAWSGAAARTRAVRSIISTQRPAAFCWGVTKDGYPKHPLYIKSGTPLILYR